MKKFEIKKIYSELKCIHKKHLEKFGIKMPKLVRVNNPNSYFQDSLCLVYLYYKKNTDVSKIELTNFIRKFIPNITDVQSARHLSTQKGWNIFKSGKIKDCFYRIDDITKPHHNWTKDRRFTDYGDLKWEDLKKLYDNRCATCGSKENEIHLKFKSDIVRLEKGHCNPLKPLTLDNTIPQCNHCNQVYKNKFIFNKNGFIEKQIN